VESIGAQVRGPLSNRATPELNTAKIAQTIRENCTNTPATPGPMREISPPNEKLDLISAATKGQK
jgi:hypothetical protein